MKSTSMDAEVIDTTKEQYDTRNGLVAQAEERTEAANLRTEEANTRTIEAEARSDLAEIRTQQANTRTMQAEARSDLAEIRTVQANTRTMQAEARSDLADIRTERAEASTAETIRASEISYRRLFETALDGILILDADSGQVVDANAFVKVMLGYSQEELLDKKLWEIGPFISAGEFKRAFIELQHTDRIRYEGLRLETKGGGTVEVEFISSTFFVDQKRLIQYNIRDITQRRLTERTASRLAAIVESSDDAIIGKDLECTILSWNTGAENLFGYSADEMVGCSILPLIPPEKMDEELRMIEKIKHGENVLHFETVRLAKDGRRIDVSVTVSPIKDSAGQVVGASKVARDITEHKRAEEQIRVLNAELEQRVTERTAQLQAVIKELETFSSSVSHDLRAPLRHIIGFVELLHKDAGPILPEKSQRHLATITKAAKRMGKLIDDLIVFSRVGRTEMEKHTIDMNELVRETVRDVPPETMARKISWNIQPLPTVRGDRALLSMVLVNLVSNAVKFTGKRDDACIEIGCTTGDCGETTFFVRDNGAGFNPKYLGKLFGVFQRLHSQEEFEGTGIGLANVQRIILRHGGRVWADGALDTGATFWFSLPQ
ncbi:MAG: PAS domain S-box protein [Verrucomicrobiota bacterium]|nr:PAS domain S-box protein [Verrucomicrobiota bacterium]